VLSSITFCGMLKEVLKAMKGSRNTAGFAILLKKTGILERVLQGFGKRAYEQT
jgi:hypothetical protein